MKRSVLELAGSPGKSKRRELDFYPTPRPATVALVKFLLETGTLISGDAIWEPACGDGAMSKVLEDYGFNVFSSDIRDSGYGISNIDFLNRIDAAPICKAVITNPPFNLSEQFIKTAIKHAPVTAMLLKSQYWHAQRRFELFNKYPPAYVLPLTWRPDFLEQEKKAGRYKNGGASTMEVVWTVWAEGNTQSIYKPLLKPTEGGMF